MSEAAHEFSNTAVAAHAVRDRRTGAVIANAVLAAALILSIVAVFAVLGASISVAQTRADLIVMDESTRLSTFLILAAVLIVMVVLTVMALRDTTPASRTKRTPVRRARN